MSEYCRKNLQEEGGWGRQSFYLEVSIYKDFWKENHNFKIVIDLYKRKINDNACFRFKES